MEASKKPEFENSGFFMVVAKGNSGTCLIYSHLCASFVSGLHEREAR